MAYPSATWERAMTVQELVPKALSGKSYSCRAAEVLGMRARTLRQWRARWEQFGYADRVGDERRHAPSVRGNMGPRSRRAFLSQALQVAGLMLKHSSRGRYTRRDEAAGVLRSVAASGEETRSSFAAPPGTSGLIRARDQ